MEGAITQEYSVKDSGRKPYAPTSKEIEKVSYVERQYKISEESKRRLLEDAWLGVAYYSGRQWAIYNRVTRLLEEPQPPAWRVRMVLNYILPTVETLCGKLVENRPGVTVLPASTDDDDVEAARQSEQLIEHLWHEMNMQLKLHEAVKWMATTGTAFFKVWWDPEAGKEYEDEEPLIEEAIEYNEEVTGEEAPKPKDKGARYKTGAPVVDVLSVMEVGWDPGAKDAETARWMLHANSMHIDQVRSIWKKGKHVSPDTSYDADDYGADVLKELSYTAQTDDSITDRVVVIEYFERPSGRHPKGYYAVVAGGVLLEDDEELPYGDLPFVLVRHVTTPGKFTGEGLVKHVIPAQKELNKSASQRLENKNLHAMPKWRAEKGSLEKNQITDQPGEIIVYNRTATRPPEPLPPPALSPEHRLIEKEQIDHISAISGISDVTRGAQPPSHASGRLIGLISDLDATKLGPTVRELESAVEKIGRRLLQYWHDFMPVAVTLKVVGRDNVAEVFDFHASQIKSTSVKIIANSMLPKHPSYRREQVMQMYQVGMLGEPQDPQTRMRARRLMEFGDRDVDAQDTKDRAYAREENHVLAAENWTEPQPWEDHITHIDEHLDYMKGVDYRLLSPETQTEFERHLAWHYYYESQQQQGVPWWQSYVGGDEGMPPGAPPGEEMPMEQTPQGQPQAQQGAPQMGLVGGGTPELNQAIGTRGPGVAEYEAGFESGQR